MAPPPENPEPGRDDDDATTQGIPVDRTQGLRVPRPSRSQAGFGTWTGRDGVEEDTDPWGRPGGRDQQRPGRRGEGSDEQPQSATVIPESGADDERPDDVGARSHADEDASPWHASSASPVTAPPRTDRGDGPQPTPAWASAAPERWHAHTEPERYDLLPPGPGPWAAPSAPAQRGPDRRPRRGGLGIAAAALVLGLLGGVGGSMAVDRWLPADSGTGARVTPATGPMIPAGTEIVEPSPIATIAQQSLPAVVFVRVGDFAFGSGFVYREDGYIVTNSHVIAEAETSGAEVEVQFSDQSVETAELVGRDVSYDLAVLRVEREGLAALPLGDSSALQVGSGVVAVGAPLGLESTVTAGIVSAIDRPVTAGQGDEASFINAVQTDAAINPGNSGGPLLDMAGRVIGVNSAIAQLPAEGVPSAGSIGLGFAIPVDQVQRTADQLIDTGTSNHPVVGVSVDMQYSGPGARVADDALTQDAVVPGGPADEAGIEAGDVILSVDGVQINGGPELIVQIRAREIGDTVTLVVQGSDEEERSVEVVLDSDGS